MTILVSRSHGTQKFVLSTEYQAFIARRQARERLLGIACYFGGMPLLWLRGIERRRNDAVYQHYRYSLAVSLTLFFILAAAAIADVLEYVYITRLWNPAPDELGTLPLAGALSSLTVGGFAFSACFFAWASGLVCAVQGNAPRFSRLLVLTRHAGWRRLALGWSVLCRFGLILLVVMAAHGSLLAAHPGSNPQVYILHTSGGYVPLPSWVSYTPPRWTFSLFFYPILVAAVKRWGEGSVVIAPLTDASFREAIHNGKFVFVASHSGDEAGSVSYAFDPYREMRPSDFQSGEAGTQLRYVYFSACYAGYREAEWKRVLTPSEVRTFSRLSFVEEHLLWVWLRGAKIIAGLK